MGRGGSESFVLVLLVLLFIFYFGFVDFGFLGCIGGSGEGLFLWLLVCVVFNCGIYFVVLWNFVILVVLFLMSSV